MWSGGGAPSHWGSRGAGKAAPPCGCFSAPLASAAAVLSLFCALGSWEELASASRTVWHSCALMLLGSKHTHHCSSEPRILL